MSSWVKVSRKLLTSAIASKPEYLAVWVHLLLSASYKPGEILVGHQVVRLQAGQLVFGRLKFSQQIGVSEHTLRMALKTLEKLQQITIKSESKFSVISITNWDKYQTDSPANHQQATSNQPASHHNKEIQELQERQEEIKSSCVQQAESPKVDRIDYQSVAAAFGEHLPALPQPRDITDKRKKAIRSIVKRGGRYAEPDFFAKFFGYVAKSDFLMARGAKPWHGCSFDWLLKPENFQKIIEGNYHGESNNA
jgi:hypothetical protein